ncbi:MAG: 4'-phosphopantetheinyl transferase superfamily protein [Clostridiales bacterium]|nr:4'-phosphopantetheinyl transferase superfamily protein [Clostridiales bacterium]
MRGKILSNGRCFPLKLYGAVNLSAQQLLERILGRDGLPALARTPLGKPYFPARPALHINWSHSGSLVLCALSGRPVGVDLELLRPRGASLPRYALTPEEYACFQRLGGDWPAFYTLWTRKEAWCKYTGEGLRRQWGQTPPEEGLYFRAYGGETWRACVCGEEPPPESIIWWEEAPHTNEETP